MSDTDPIEWQLLDSDLQTVLAILPVGSDPKLYVELNEPGSGEVRVPRESSAAGLVTSGQFVRASYRGAFRGGFFVENTKNTDASGGEAGDDWLSISGRGPLALLDDAIVWDNGSIDSTREFASASKASVLIDLIDEAQARGGLAILTYDFTATLDSDGNAWTDDQAVELTVGKSLLAVLRDFAKKGLEFDISLETDGTFTLHAYITKGTDKSETVFFRIGTNCTEVSGEELGGGIKNVLRVKYKYGFTTVQDATSIAARRRRESLVQEESAGNSDAAITFGQSRLESSKDPQNSINIKLYDGVSPFAFVDYNMGDTVTLDKKGTEAEYRVRGMQLVFREDFADITLSLNSTIIENEIRMALEIENLRELWTRLTDTELPITSFWTALGLPGDTITRINDMVIIGTKLYIAFGDLTDSTLIIGGITARGVACLDLETGLWAPLSNGGLLGLSGTGWSLAAYGTDLYISGDFNNPGGAGLIASLVCVYDTVNKTWSDVGGSPIGPGVPAVQAFAYNMVVDNGVLYYGGLNVDGGSAGIVMYTIATDTWATIGTWPGGDVRGIAISGSNIYTAGSNGVHHYNGASWSQLSTLGGGTGLAIALWRSGLAVGGNFTSPGNYIAFYDFDDTTWYALGSGLDDVCRAMAVRATDLYAAGDFLYADGILCNHAAKHNGGSWTILQDGLGGTTNQDGYAIVVWDLNIIFGGNFETAGGKAALAIAAYLVTLEQVFEYLDTTANGGVLHNQLPDLQGGDKDADELYHLTETQHTDLTTGINADAQHSHNADNVNIEEIGTATYDDVQDFINQGWSSGWLSGGVLSDGGGGTVDVSAGTGFIATADDANARIIKSFDWGAFSTTAIASGTTRYIFMDYNGGSPTYSLETSYDVDELDKFLLGWATNDGGTLHIINAHHRAGNVPFWIEHALREMFGFKRADNVGGIALSEDGANRYVGLSAGEIYFGLNEFSIGVVDTDPGGAADTMTRYYRVAGVWTKQTGLTQWPNTQYTDGSDLQTMTTNRYGNIWVYVDVEDNEVILLYGTSNVVSAELAEAEQPPVTLPDRVSSHCVLAGRFVFQKSAAAAELVQSAFETVFQPIGGGGTGTPGGSDTQIQYNDGGSFGGDSEFIWDDVNKSLIMGSYTLPGTGTGAFHQINQGVSPSHLMWSFGSGYAGFIVGLHANGTVASPTAVALDDVLFVMRGRGYDGSTWSVSQAYLQLVADENWNGTSHGTRIEAYITPNGYTTPELGMTVDENGVTVPTGKDFNRGSLSVIDSLTTGWIPVDETWTYASADDPVYQIYVSGDITADPDYKLGNKVWCQNNSTDFFGFIVKVGSYDGGNDRTPIDIYGGQNYDLANSAITAPYISKVKSPDGFSLDRDDWDWIVTDTTQRLQSSPGAGTWYNLGSVSIDVPIGKWDMKTTLDAAGVLSGGGQISVFCTLSTGSSSESNPEYTSKINSASALSQFESSMILSGLISVTGKTTYYVNTKSNQAITTIYNQNGQLTLIIRLELQYL